MRLRRRLPVLLLCVLQPACSAPPAAQVEPQHSWPVALAPSIDTVPLRDLHDAFLAGRHGNVDRMLVVHDGRLVFDRRYQRDYAAISSGRRSHIGCGAGACTGLDWASSEFNYFDPAIHPFYRGRGVHTLQSVTKSVAATVIGAAIHRGDLPGTGAPLLSLLRDYDLSRTDPRLARATLAHLLTMRSGIEWHEQDRPLDSTNTTLQLERSRDWVAFTLAQPMDAEPGEKWAYSSGGSHLMSAIIRTATGRTIDRYAEEVLFRPLGIRDFHWKQSPTGLPDTEGGLFLAAEDLARIGQLYLDDGVWAGRRILPEGWVAAATARQVERPGFGYGYQWWRLDRGEIAVWAGLGFGGQYLIVVPSRRLIGVVNAWNVFGERVADPLRPFVDALLAASAAR